jgi:hypothetical protein
MRGATIAALLLIAVSASAQETKPCGCSCPADDDSGWRASVPIQVPDAGHVSANVAYESGPLPGVIVTLEKSGVRYEQVSDANGDVDFFNVLPGEYRLHGELVGMKPAVIRTFIVPAGAVSRAQLHMKLDKSEMIVIDDTDDFPALPDPGTFTITRRMMEALPLP